MDEQTFATTFKQSPIRRAKYQGLQRNLSWALSNEAASTDRLRTGAPANADSR